MGTFKQTFLINSAMDIENGERPYGLSEKEISLFSDRGLDPAREYELLVKFLKSRKRLNPGEQVTDDILNLVNISGSRSKGIIRTDTDGAAKISETVRGLNIRTSRNFQFERVFSLSDENGEFSATIRKMVMEHSGNYYLPDCHPVTSSGESILR